MLGTLERESQFSDPLTAIIPTPQSSHKDQVRKCLLRCSVKTESPESFLSLQLREKAPELHSHDPPLKSVFVRLVYFSSKRVFPISAWECSSALQRRLVRFSKCHHSTAKSCPFLNLRARCYHLPLEHQTDVPQFPAKIPVGSCPLEKGEKFNVYYYALLVTTERDSCPILNSGSQLPMLGSPFMGRLVKSSIITIS